MQTLNVVKPKWRKRKYLTLCRLCRLQNDIQTPLSSVKVGRDKYTETDTTVTNYVKPD